MNTLYKRAENYLKEKSKENSLHLQKLHYQSQIEDMDLDDRNKGKSQSHRLASVKMEEALILEYLLSVLSEIEDLKLRIIQYEKYDH